MKSVDTRYNVEELFPHGNFSGKPNYSNDIGLIRIVKEKEFDEKVKIDYSPETVPENSKLKVYTWGIVDVSLTLFEIMNCAEHSNSKVLFCQ